HGRAVCAVPTGRAPSSVGEIGAAPSRQARSDNIATWCSLKKPRSLARDWSPLIAILAMHATAADPADYLAAAIGNPSRPQADRQRDYGDGSMTTGQCGGRWRASSRPSPSI